MDAEQLLESLPRFNVLQVSVVLSYIAITIRGPWQIFGVIFWARVPQNYTCKIPEGQVERYNATQCTLIDLETKTESPCTEWDYFDLQPSQSIITEWNLVCSAAYLPVLDQTLYLAGQLTGALFLTNLSDRVGRRPSVLVGLLVQALLAVALMCSVSIYMLIPLRFLMACANQVVVTTSYVLLAEWFVARHRSFATGSMISFVIGIVAMSGVAYLVRDWRGQILAFSVIPNSIVFILYFFLPESLFFLCTNGRYPEVQNLMKRVKWQKDTTTGLSVGHGTMEMIKRASTIDRKSQKKMKKEAASSFRKAVWDIVTSPKMLSYTLGLCWMSTTLSLIYYVATVNTSQLSGDIYINNAISGSIELPFTLLALVLGVFAPRIIVIFGFYVVAVASFLTYSFVPISVLYFAGRAALSACYLILVLFAAETFPTIVRNAGLGFFQVGDNLGPIIGPTIAALPFADSGSASLYFLMAMITSVSAIFISLMAETKGKPLPETVREIEQRPALSLWRCKCFETKNTEKEAENSVDASFDIAL